MPSILKILFSLCVAIAMLSSCGSIKKINVEEVRNLKVQPQGLNKFLIDAEVLINNPSRYKVTIQGFNIDLVQKEKQIATLSTLDTLQISKQSREYYSLRLEIKIPSLLSAISLFQGEKISESILVEGEIKVKAAILKKVIRIAPQSLASFSKQYGDILRPLYSR
ncbi:MAG: hypothetical protein ACRCY6_04645 [Bacteroidales bacterium]